MPLETIKKCISEAKTLTIPAHWQSAEDGEEEVGARVIIAEKRTMKTTTTFLEYCHSVDQSIVSIAATRVKTMPIFVSLCSVGATIAPSLSSTSTPSQTKETFLLRHWIINIVLFMNVNFWSGIRKEVHSVYAQECEIDVIMLWHEKFLLSLNGYAFWISLTAKWECREIENVRQIFVRVEYRPAVRMQ